MRCHALQIHSRRDENFNTAIETYFTLVVNNKLGCFNACLHVSGVKATDLENSENVALNYYAILTTIEIGMRDYKMKSHPILKLIFFHAITWKNI